MGRVLSLPQDSLAGSLGLGLLNGLRPKLTLFEGRTLLIKSA